MMSEETHARKPPRAQRSAQLPREMFVVEQAVRQSASRRTPAFDQPVDGRYRPLARLGSGRLGPIYEAADEFIRESGIERHVAIQLLDANLVAGRRFTGEFERGVKSLQAIWHPNIVRLLDAGRNGDHFYLVMELLDCASLRFVLNDVGKLPLEETAAVIGSIGDALQYLHAKSIVHGNLKPENVLVTFDYEVKLLDVVPPEWPAALSDQADEQDVYGLACLAYEMLAGRHPYNTNTPDEALRAGLTPAPIGFLSAGQWRALAGALELRREHRTPSLKQFLDEFGIAGAPKLRAIVARDAADAADAASPAPDPDPALTAASDAVPLYPRVATRVLLPEREEPDEPERSGIGGILLALVLLAALVYAWADRNRLGEEINAWVADDDAVVPAIATSEPATMVDAAPPVTADSMSAAPAEVPAIAAAPVPIAVRAQPAAPTPMAVPAQPAASGPQQFSFDQSRVEVRESEVAARIVIRRSGDAAQSASIAWWTQAGSATAGRDFADLGRRVEQFEAGEQERIVFVPLANDSNAEPAEYFNVYLNPVDAGRGRSPPLSRLRVDIINDD